MQYDWRPMPPIPDSGGCLDELRIRSHQEGADTTRAMALYEGCQQMDGEDAERAHAANRTMVVSGQDRTAREFRHSG